MVISWIVTRSPKEVEYFANETYDGRHIALLATAVMHEYEPEISAAATNAITALRGAKTELWELLRSGQLSAVGIRAGDRDIRRIPVRDWQYLEPFDDDVESAEVIHISSVRRRDTESRNRTAEDGYDDVTIDRVDVLKKWPAPNLTPADSALLKPIKRKSPGRPQEPFWREVTLQLEQKIAKDGLPGPDKRKGWQRQADVEHLMERLVDELGHDVHISTIRRHAVRILKALGWISPSE